MQRAVSYGFALADGLPNLNGGLPPPAAGLPLATDSKDNNLAAVAAALVAFGIGPSRNCQQKFTISYSNYGPNLLL